MVARIPTRVGSLFFPLEPWDRNGGGLEKVNVLSLGSLLCERPILIQYVPPHGFSMGLWSPGHPQCLSSRCGSVCCCKCHCSPFFAAVVPLCVLLELTQHFGWREVECVWVSVSYASKCVIHNVTPWLMWMLCNVTPCSCGCCVISSIAIHF